MQNIVRRLSYAAAFTLSAFASTGHAQLTVYTDRAAFEAALGTFVVETFGGTSISAPGLSSGGTSDGAILGGRWVDRVGNGGPSMIWTFDGGSYGFGGDWDLRPNGPGQGIQFFATPSAGGGDVLVPSEVPPTYSGEFFGFISVAPFSSVRYEGGTLGTSTVSGETYALDNLTFGGTPMTITATPEPATLALLGGGLIAVAGIARRRIAPRRTA